MKVGITGCEKLKIRLIKQVVFKICNDLSFSRKADSWLKTDGIINPQEKIQRKRNMKFKHRPLN